LQQKVCSPQIICAGGKIRLITTPQNPYPMQPNAEFDSPWKSMIELYFRPFMQFYFPAIEAEIDWTYPPKFLDQELQKIVRDGEIGKRYADKLVQVRSVKGKEMLIVLHIEVQSQQEAIFPNRMLTYNYRLRDRYNCTIVSLALLGDDSPTWRPNSFQDSHWGCTIAFEFPMVKLLDYKDDWEALENNENPFAIVTMAHLKTKETHNDPAARKTWKFRLTMMLYDRGYKKQDILSLYNFLDFMMTLPESLSQQFDTELEAFEETKKMKYVTTIERRAEARGLKLGESRKVRSIVQRQLTHRFGELQDALLTTLDGLSIDDLDQLSESLLDFTTIEDLTHWLEIR
jgi:Domain of unknown function (DUF4351)